MVKATNDRLAMTERPIWRRIPYKEAAAFFASLLTLELLTRWLSIPTYLLPSPSRLCEAFLENYPMMITHTSVTLLEAGLGFALACLVGLTIGISYVRWDLLRRVSYPVAVALQTTPVIAISTIMIVWFGGGLLSHVMTAVLVAFFPVLVGTYQGATAIQREMLQVFHCLAASRFQTLVWLRIPAAMPRIISGVEVSAVLSVVGAIVGEFTSANAGVGHMILITSYRNDTPLLFAYVVLSAGIGFILIGLVRLVRGRLVFWEPAQ